MVKLIKKKKKLILLFNLCIFPLIMNVNNVPKYFNEVKIEYNPKMAQSATYYVATDGDDSYTNDQAQSPDSPWATISKATSEVLAGDTIVVAQGLYEEAYIDFANSGNASQWITLTAAPGAKVEISKSGENRSIFIYSRSYIHINGLTLHGYDQDGLSIFESDYILCTNIHAYDNGNAGINSFKTDHIIIQDCELHHNGWKRFNNSGWGDGASVNNQNAKGYTSIFRRNICYANWQKRNGSYWDGNGYTLDMAGDDGLHIVDYNLFFNNGGTGLLASTTGNMHISHNVFFRDGSDPEDRNYGEVYLVGEEANDTKLKNNIIFSRPGNCTIDRYVNGGTDRNDEEICTNLIWGEDGNNTWIWWLEFNYTTMPYWIENRAPDTLTGDPSFKSAPFDNNYTTFREERWIEMNIDDYDFTLQADSQCVDAGSFLTTAKNAGYGIELEVEDAGYFFDGYGKIKGDEIIVGSNSIVEITNINYTTNIITLATPINWKEGESVHFKYSGSAPDIGAFELEKEDNQPYLSNLLLAIISILSVVGVSILVLITITKKLIKIVPKK